MVSNYNNYITAITMSLLVLIKVLQLPARQADIKKKNQTNIFFFLCTCSIGNQFQLMCCEEDNAGTVIQLFSRGHLGINWFFIELKERNATLTSVRVISTMLLQETYSVCQLSYLCINCIIIRFYINAAWTVRVGILHVI